MLSYWERMANAVIAFSEMLLLSQNFHFGLYAPLVHRSALGSNINPFRQTNLTHYQDINFETYFNYSIIQNGTFDLIPHSVYSNVNLNDSCNVFHVLIDYGGDNCSWSKNHYKIQSSVDIKCVPPFPSMKKTAHHEGKLFEYFQQIVDLGGQFCNNTVILYEWRKVGGLIGTPPLQKLVWSGLSDKVKMYSKQVISLLFGDEIYHTIQFRGGYFYRPSRVNKTLSQDEQMMASLKKIFQAVPPGTKNIFFATDMYSTIPEGSDKPDSIRSAALETAMKYAYHSTGYNVRTLQNVSLSTSSSLDEITLAALVDAQIVMTSPTVTLIANSVYANTLCEMNKNHYHGSCVWHKAYGE